MTTTHPVGLPVWSILAGNATIAAFVTARRALSPSQLTRACLLVVGAAGVLMTAEQDGHGVGILTGAGIALLVLLRRRAITARHPLGPLRRVVATVAGVWLLTALTWIAWVRLLGVELLVATPNGGTSAVGWLSVSVVAMLSALGACAALRLLRGPAIGSPAPWIGLCVGVTLVSLAGPLSEAVGASSLAGLISLHLVCGTTAVALARHRAEPKADESA